MKKIAVCGHVGHGQTTLARALIAVVEAKTGEQVECVMVHKEDAEFWNRPLEPKPSPELIEELRLSPPDIELKEVFREQKIKGHQRPYKFHR